MNIWNNKQGTDGKRIRHDTERRLGGTGGKAQAEEGIDGTRIRLNKDQVEHIISWYKDKLVQGSGGTRIRWNKDQEEHMISWYKDKLDQGSGGTRIRRNI